MADIVQPNQPVIGATDNPNVQQPPAMPQTPPSPPQGQQTAPTQPQPSGGIQLSGPSSAAQTQQPAPQAPQQPQQPQDPYAQMGAAPVQQQGAKQDPYMQMGAPQSPDEQPSALDAIINASPDDYRKMANNPAFDKFQQYLPEIAVLKSTLNGIANLKEMKADPSKDITPEGAGLLAMLFGIPGSLEAGAGAVGEGVAGAASKAGEQLNTVGSGIENTLQASKAAAQQKATIEQQMKGAFNQAGEQVGGGTEPMLTKTAGELTQNPTIQRREMDMTRGAAGPQAEDVASQFAAGRNAQMKETPGIAGAVEGARPQDQVNTIASIIRSNEASSNKAIDAQYEIAKNSADGAGITQEHMQGILPKPDKHGFVNLPSGEGKAPVTINPETTKSAYQQYLKLKDIITPEAEETTADIPAVIDKIKDTAANIATSKDKENILTPLQIWRQQTTNLAKSAAGTPDGFALRSLVKTYDEHMDNLASSLPEEGSEGITAFKQAVAMRREHGQNFENNNFVQSVVNGDKSIDDLTNEALGSGTVKSKKDMANTYDATVQAAGDQSPAVQKAWQQALAQKIYNNAATGTRLPNSNEAAISTAKLQTELTNLFQNQREFATKVFGPEDAASARQAIAELKTINSTQKGVANPSGSGYTAIRLGTDAAQKGLSQIPYIGWMVKYLKGIGQTLENYKAGDEAQQLFSGQVPKKYKGAP